MSSLSGSMAVSGPVALWLLVVLPAVVGAGLCVAGHRVERAAAAASG